MMRQVGRALAAVALVLVAGTAALEGSLRFPSAEQTAQQRIGELVETIIAINSGQAAQDIEAKADTLLRSVGGDRELVMQQLCVYRAWNPGNESAMSSALLLNYYDFTPSEIRAALAPLLDADDAVVQSSALELLASIDSAHGARPDPSLYADLLGRHEQPPLGLVRYLYSLSPIDALAVTSKRYMVHDEADSALQTAFALERDRAESNSGDLRITEANRDQIRRLSQHPAWWFRLYAAALLRDQPELGSDETVSRLRSDPHPLIRETLPK